MAVLPALMMMNAGNQTSRIALVDASGSNLSQPVSTALKSPGASAVIYGGVDATGIVFHGVAEAMRVPHSDIRLFGKPESFTKRRMGAALVFDADVEVARTQAKLAASLVKPRTA